MRIAAWLLGAFFTAVSVAGGVFFYGYRQVEAPGPLTEDRSVVIGRGTGLVGIADQLLESGVIGDRLLFLAAAKLTGAERDLKAGEFAFAAGTSILGAIELLRSGRTVVRTLTVPEGLTVARVLALVVAEPTLTGPVGEAPPEGSLLPDTYHFAFGDSRAELLQRMRQAMDEALAEAWAGRNPEVPLRSSAEALVLASIIEKETGVAAERARVAGVFVNRLRAGMRLQSDPTVVYALSDRSGQLGRPLTRADWQVDSPYNTYQIEGLPPGPIANPGRAAIAAALNPEEHAFLYFVADGSGGHAFAASLAQHNRNVAHWRRVRRELSERP